MLDDAVQCTELDEHSYQEMISFLPLNIHPDPKRVLIIGGGDGGVAREVSKHPRVEQIVQCEIDQEVVNVSKKHLPFMASGFDSAKLKLLFADGYKYVLEHKNQFDVIITDSSDPKVTLKLTYLITDIFMNLYLSEGTGSLFVPEGVLPGLARVSSRRGCDLLSGRVLLVRPALHQESLHQGETDLCLGGVRVHRRGIVSFGPDWFPHLFQDR